MQYIFFDTNDLQSHLNNYLNWYDMIKLEILNKYINKKFIHPFVYLANDYYRLQDGSKKNIENAKFFFIKTRNKFGSELVETAILANRKKLDKLNYTIDLEGVENIIRNGFTDDLLQDVHKEICLSLKLSKFSLYNSLKKKYYNGNCITNMSDIIYLYEFQYYQNCLSNFFLEKDAQIKEIVTKTNISTNYIYIFTRCFLLERFRASCLLNVVGKDDPQTSIYQFI